MERHCRRYWRGEEVQQGGEGAENVNVAAENPPTKEAQPQPDVRVC